MFMHAPRPLAARRGLGLSNLSVLPPIERDSEYVVPVNSPIEVLARGFFVRPASLGPEPVVTPTQDWEVLTPEPLQTHPIDPRVISLDLPVIPSTELAKIHHDFMTMPIRMVSLPQNDFRLVQIHQDCMLIITDDVKISPFEYAQRLRNANPISSEALFDAIALLDSHDINATTSECIPVKGNTTQLDLDLFLENNGYRPILQKHSIKQAILDVAYWRTIYISLHSTDHENRDALLQATAHVIRHLSSLALYVIAMGDDPEDKCGELGLLLNDLLYRVECDSNPLVAQGVTGPAVLGVGVVAAAVWAGYHYTRQAPPPENPDHLNPLELLVQRFLRGGAQKSKEIVDWLLGKLSHVFNVAGHIAGYLYDALGGIYDTILELFVGPWVVKIPFVKALSRVIAMLVAITLVSIGVVTYSTVRLAMMHFAPLGDIPEETNPLSAQGPFDTAGFTAAFIGCLFCLPSPSQMTLTKYASWMKNVTIIGAGSATIFTMIGSLLPSVFRRAIFQIFASEEELKIEAVTEISTVMDRLEECSRNPEVLATKEYTLIVAEAMNQGMYMMENSLLPKDTTAKTHFYSVYNRLMAVHKHLKAGDGPTARAMPFTIHITGDPGVGKSYGAKYLSRDLGFDKNSVYAVPKASAFWDGYRSESVILIDEFLVGNSQKTHDEALTYLQLIGDTPFSPPLASVDNPQVGIKGTRAAPDLVITMNNHHTVPVNTISTEALQRRRNVVIEVAILKDARMKDGKVDLAAYTKEEILTLAWAGCKIHSPFTYDTSKEGFMTWPVMVNELKAMYAEHTRIGKKVSEAQNVSTDQRQYGVELLIRSLTQVTKESDLSTKAMSILLGRTLTAQGDSRFSTQGNRRPRVTPPVLATPKPDVSSEDLISETPEDFDPFEDIILDDGIALVSQDLITEPKDIPITAGYLPSFHKMTEFVTSPAHLSVLRRFGQIAALIASMATVGLIFNRMMKKEGPVAQSAAGKNHYKASKGSKSYSSKAARESARNHREDALYSQGGPTHVTLSYRGLNLIGVGICQNFVLTYAHSLLDQDGELPDDNKPIQVTIGDETYASVLRREDVYEYPTSDLAIVRINCKQMPQFKNVVKSFATDNDLADCTTLRAQFGSKGELYPVVVDMAQDISYTCGYRTITLAHAWFYSFNTRQGDCGKLLRAVESTPRGAYIGMHVAGTSSASDCEAVATIVTREMLEQAIAALTNPPSLSAQGNLLYSSPTETRDYTPLPTKSKLKKSVFYDLLAEPTDKEPPVFSTGDPRSNGTDPVLNAIHTNDESEPWVKLDTKKMKKIEDETYNYIMAGLRPSTRPRKLTIREAVEGLPGVLKSMNAATSVGYPYNKLVEMAGKKEFFYFDEDGKLNMSDDFVRLVEDKLESIANGEAPDHYWLGYLKDELVSQKKIATATTRIIYAGDVVTMTALRVHLGTILAAFNSPESDCGVCIGFNQYSDDMDIMYQRLKGTGDPTTDRFLAGDFQGYDKHYVEAVRDSAYKILFRIAEYYDLDGHACAYLYDYDTKSPAIVGDRLFRMFVSFYSGGLFTTIINSIVNMLYVRYAFSRCHPREIFDECVRMLAHGDDHIIHVFNPNVDFDAVILAEYLGEINQVYTNDDKTAPVPGYRRFDQITFLGARPQKHNGRYVGVMLKKSINQALSYTTDNDLSAPGVASQMGEYASFHDEEYYNSIVNTLNQGLQKLGFSQRFNSTNMTVHEIRDIVSRRNAASGFTYSRISYDSGPRVKVTNPTPNKMPLVAQGDSVSSQGYGSIGDMTVLRTDRVTASTGASSKDKTATALSASPNDMSYGPNSMVLREELSWSTTDIVETELALYSTPWGLLETGGTDGMQNMPFDLNSYWKGTTEITVQVNGTRFTQGLLCVYFYPLSSASTIRIDSWTSCEHVLLSANANSTATLTIPYRYPKPVMNTRHRSAGHSLGGIHIAVLSTLQASEPTTLTVSVYSRFPDSKFFLPRSRHIVSADAKRAREEKRKKLKYIAQGNFQSSSTVNEYNISDVAGSVPIQTNNEADQDARATADLQLPMDKPPLASGAVPTQQQFSGMSKALGLNPCVSMQLSSTASYRQGGANFDNREVEFDYLLGLPCHHQRIPWALTDPPGAVLEEYCINSIFSRSSGGNVVAPTYIGPNIALLNAFTYWKCDWELEFVVVRTPIHSGRLAITVGYGEPDTTTMQSDRNSFINTILDFSGDADRQTVTIPYNAQTEFLRTYEGDTGATWSEDQQAGFVTISVANALVAPDTVAASVDILIFLRIKNAVMAVPRPTPFWFVIDEDLNRGGRQLTAPLLGKTDLVAQGEGPQSNVGTGAIADEKDAAQTMPVTTGDTTTATAKPCKMILGARFEYTPRTTTELARRYVQTTLGGRTSAIVNYTDLYRNLEVTPKDLFSWFYAGYSGGLNIRIYQDSAGRPRPVLFYPQNHGLDSSNADDRDYYGHLTNTVTQMVVPTDGAVPESSLAYESAFSRGVPSTREMMYPISQTGWIDVNLPCQCHLDFLPVSHIDATAGSLYGTDLGILSIPTTSDTETDYPDEAVYIAAADDFSYGIYRPPRAIAWQPIGVQVISEDARILGGWWNSNYHGVP